MSSVTRVPETSSMAADELSADDARETLRQYGRWKLVKDSFIRFRYGDGFSHSRALGLQLTLSIVPLGIAFVGLATTVHADRVSRVLRETLLRLTPGSTDSIVRQTLDKGQNSAGRGDSLALWIGLAVAVVALTTAMGQVERGANRIYGVQRDRPALHKYLRAVTNAVTAGLFSLIGFVIVVAGGKLGHVLASVYAWSDRQLDVWLLLRYPIGILLALASFTLLIERAPRRRQPGWSWISIGAGVSLALWVLLTGLLALYVQTSGSFGSTYGPLTGVMALLLWANLTSVAIFLGIAFSAQLEAVHGGVMEPQRGDPEAVTPSAAREASGGPEAVTQPR
jgi:YihY family inner membrane protein